MKQLIGLITLLSLFSLCASAQDENASPLGTPTSAVQVKGKLYADSGLFKPKRKANWTPVRAGATTHDPSDTMSYDWDGTAWKPTGSQAYNNIAELSSLPAIKLAKKALYKVAGFYSPGDGGGGEFYWDDTATSAPVQGMIIQVPGVMTGRFKRKEDRRSVLPAWFGTIGDSSDAADKLQAAVNYASVHGINRIVIPNGKYSFSKTVFVPYNVSVVGVSTDSVRFYSMSNGRYFHEDGTTDNHGYLLWQNIDTNTLDWIVHLPAQRSGEYGNFYIDGTPSSGCNGIYIASSAKIHNIQTYHVSTCIRKIRHYLDQLDIEHIHSQKRNVGDTSKYYIYIEGNGDALNISYVESNITDSFRNAGGVYIESSRGGRLFGLINGLHYFKNTQNLEMTTCHLESGGVILDNASAYIHNNAFYVGDSNRYCIKIQKTDAETDNYQVTIANNMFTCMAGFSGGWGPTDKPDIMINTTEELVVLDNNRREATFPGDDDRRQSMGILVGDSAGIWADWYNYSYLLSPARTVISDNHTVVTGTVENHIYGWGGFAGANKKNREPGGIPILWQAPSGNYYYGCELLTDPVRRIGRRAIALQEKLVANLVSEDDSIPEFTIDKNFIPRRGGYIIRFYRGTSTNNYSKYVDIPVLDMRRFWDNGVSVNGFIWHDRTPGPIDTLTNTNQALAGSAEYIDGNVTVNSIYSPGFISGISGTWQQGDEIRITNPSANPSGNMLKGYLRATTGGGNVIGTDWLREYVSNDSVVSYSVSVAGTDFQTTSTSAVSVTGLSTHVEANKKYKVVVTLKTGCTGTNGLFFGLAGPSGTTVISGTAIISTTTASSVGFIRIPSIGSLTTTAANRFIGSSGSVQITAFITTGSTAGNVTIQIAAANGAETNSVITGSTMEVVEDK